MKKKNEKDKIEDMQRLFKYIKIKAFECHLLIFNTFFCRNARIFQLKTAHTMCEPFS